MILKKYVRILFIGLIPILNSCEGCRNGLKGDPEPEGPTFELVTRDEYKSIFTDQTAEMYLKIISKEIPKQRATYIIKEIEISKGELFFDRENSYLNENNPRKVEVGNKFNFDVDSHTLPLIFRPTGEIGQAMIKLTIEDGKGNEKTVSSVIEIQSSLRAELRRTYGGFFINKDKKVLLEIFSNDKDAKEEEYIVKKLEVTKGELRFENGEVVKEGSKLKYGKQELVFKTPKELEDITDNKATIKLTIENGKGSESVASNEFEVLPITFHVEVARIRWSKYDEDPNIFKPEHVEKKRNELLDEGFVEFELKLKLDEKCPYSYPYFKEQFGKKPWKLVNCKSSDGSPVTIMGLDIDGNKLSEFPLSGKLNDWLYFKLGDIRLGTGTTLTLQVEGPCNTMQEATIEVPADRKLDMLENGIRHFLHTTREVNEGIIYNLSLSPSVKGMWSELKNAKELSQQAGIQIALFEKPWKQVKVPKDLVDILSGSALDDLQELYAIIADLRYNKAQLDNYYKL